MDDYAGFEIRELVGVYQVFRQDAPRDMVVKVYLYEETGKYEGKCNYSYWGPEQGGSYQNSSPKYDSKEEAVRGSLDSLNLHHRANFSADQYGWEMVENPQKLIVLGSGEILTKKEFLGRQKKK